MPSAAHTWLGGEREGQAKHPLSQARAALYRQERLVQSLEFDVAKFTDEIDFLDQVLRGEKRAPALDRHVVQKRKAPLVQFSDVEITE